MRRRVCASKVTISKPVGLIFTLITLRRECFLWRRVDVLRRINNLLCGTGHLQGIDASDSNEERHRAHVDNEDADRHHSRLGDAEDGQHAEEREEADGPPVDIDPRAEVGGVGDALGGADHGRGDVGQDREAGGEGGNGLGGRVQQQVVCASVERNGCARLGTNHAQNRVKGASVF